MEITNSADAVFSTTMPGVAQYDSLAAGALGRGIDAATGKDYEKAVREFRRCIAMSPFSENAQKAYEYMASALMSSGKTDEAVATYRQAIRIFPSADGFNNALGNIYFSLDRTEEALSQYEEACRKNPTSSTNIYSLGQTYMALGRHREAEDQFNKVVQISPADYGGYLALGQVYREEGRYGEAEDMFNKVKAMKKDFVGVHYELGMNYVARQEIDKAKEELAIVLEDDPQSYIKLQNEISLKSAPRFIAAYVANLKMTSPPGTEVASLDDSLAAGGARKSFSATFIFDKQLDAASVRNVGNWSIRRSTSATTGGLYNWGSPDPDTEVSIDPVPDRVIYDPNKLTANVTFTIRQNAAANGTIDLSHLVFKFNGTDLHGNRMDDSADEYNAFTQIA